MLATVFKENSISNKRKKVNFRRNFKEADFIQDVHQAPLHLADIFEEVNDSYWAYQSLLMDFVNEHASAPPPQNKNIQRKTLPHL